MLDAAFDVIFKLIMSTPMDDFLVYPKLSKSYYALLTIITRDHMRVVSGLSPESFLYVVVFSLYTKSTMPGTWGRACLRG